MSYAISPCPYLFLFTCLIWKKVLIASNIYYSFYEVIIFQFLCLVLLCGWRCSKGFLTLTHLTQVNPRRRVRCPLRRNRDVKQLAKVPESVRSRCRIQMGWFGSRVLFSATTLHREHGCPSPSVNGSSFQV